jgi:hypothetical protein
LIPKEVKYICPPPKVNMPKKSVPSPHKTPEKMYFEIYNRSPLMNRNLVQPSNFHIPFDNKSIKNIIVSHKNEIIPPHKKNDKNQQIKILKDKVTHESRRMSVPYDDKNNIYHEKKIKKDLIVSSIGKNRLRTA